MATVRKRKWIHNGEAKEAWVVEYTDQEGRRRRVTPKSGLKRDADRERLRIETEVEAGTHTALNESQTIKAAVREFHLDCQRRVSIGDMTNAGSDGYEYRLRAFVAAYGARKVSALAQADVQTFVDAQRAQYAAATVCGNYTAIVSFLSFCVRRRWVRRNILKDDPCRLPKTSKRASIPSRSDILKLLDCSLRIEAGENLRTHLNRQATVHFGILCGLRPGEVYGLQWEDIDLEAGLIHVRHNFTKKDGLKAPKSAAGIRDVPLTKPVVQVLERFARHNALWDVANAPGHRAYNSKAISNRMNKLWHRSEVAGDIQSQRGFVLMTKMGTPLRAEASIGYWHKLMKNAGLYDHQLGKVKFTPHALRHAAVSLMLERAMPAMNLRTVIGHASVETTYGVYGHIFPENRTTSDMMTAIANDLDATRTRQEPVSRSIH